MATLTYIKQDWLQGAERVLEQIHQQRTNFEQQYKHALGWAADAPINLLTSLVLAEANLAPIISVLERLILRSNNGSLLHSPDVRALFGAMVQAYPALNTTNTHEAIYQLVFYNDAVGQNLQKIRSVLNSVSSAPQSSPVSWVDKKGGVHGLFAHATRYYASENATSARPTMRPFNQLQ